MMYYGRYTDPNGFRHEKIYYSLSEWHSDTFSPLVTGQALFKFSVSGKTWLERKWYLRDLAMDWQWLEAALSWDDYTAVHDWFYKMARRYGLVRELRETGVL